MYFSNLCSFPKSLFLVFSKNNNRTTPPSPKMHKNIYRELGNLEKDKNLLLSLLRMFKL